MISFSTFLRRFLCHCHFFPIQCQTDNADLKPKLLQSHLYTYLCINTCIYTYIYIPVYKHKLKYTCILIYTYIKTYLYIYIHTYIHTYILIYLYTYVHQDMADSFFSNHSPPMHTKSRPSLAYKRHKVISTRKP